MGLRDKEFCAILSSTKVSFRLCVCDSKVNASVKNQDISPSLCVRSTLYGP